MKQKTIHMTAILPHLKSGGKKSKKVAEKVIIDPNWLYYLREAERNEKQVINR